MKRFLRFLLNKIPYVRCLLEQIQCLLEQIQKQGAYPAGYYYSPIPEQNEVLAYFKTRKPLQMELPDVDLNRDGQLRLLNEYAKFYDEIPFPEEKTSDYRYFFNNGLFSYADAIFLYSFLRRHKPRRIIEIGSGFSSAVILDTIEQFFSQRPEITFIEPYPDRLKSLLKSYDKDQVNIIEKKLQEVPYELFSSLKSGDFLFIDSSHVIKCGSDLHLLLFNILPLLPSGIFVHFHDVFYPFDYPSQWLKDGIFWNENYFLRAFLAHNCEWRVHFFNDYVGIVFYEFIRDKMPLCLKNSGGSLYICRR